MRNIKLKSPSLDQDWSKQFMDEGHYDTLFDEDVAVFKPDGSPLLVLLKKALDPQLASNAWAVLKKINAKTENRAIASGASLEPRKKIDGSLSRVVRVPRGWEVTSGIIGYFERTVREPYGHACAWNAKNPRLFAQLFPLLQQTSVLFMQNVPQRFHSQQLYCTQTHRDWVIPGTVYTTLTINKNFRTAAHKDVGDLDEGFSNMFVIKQGTWSGGHLVLPNWRVAVKLDNLDLILFDAHEFHGNTQIVKLSKDAIRCSVVCYYRQKMIHCKSAAEELRGAKNRKRGDPLFPEAE